jgi:hypothetical protein
MHFVHFGDIFIGLAYQGKGYFVFRFIIEYGILAPR